MEDEQLLLDLDRVRERTRWYHVPLDAGASYRELLSGLRGLEIDLRRHMRVESRILYPKVVAFEAEMLNRRLTRNAAG
jgi:iron-sulfur cluster repair protein YtfE (RIC family)